MPMFPAVDLTDFDPAPTVDSVRSVGNSIATAAAGVAREATYTAVGLSILTYQRIQVRRRELERELQR